jgi:dGTPase
LLLDLAGDAGQRHSDIEDQAWRIAHLRATAIGRLAEQSAAVFLDHEGEILAGRMAGDILARCPAKGGLAAIADLTETRIFRTRERNQTEIAGAEILTTLLSSFAGALAEREASSKRSPSPRAVALLRLLPGPLPAAEARYEWLLRLVDFISGMTDGYALTMFRRLKGLTRE